MAYCICSNRHQLLVEPRLLKTKYKINCNQIFLLQVLLKRRRRMWVRNLELKYWLRYVRVVLFTKHLACYKIYSRSTYVDFRLKYYHCLQLWVDSYFQFKPCGQLVVKVTRLGAKTWLTKQPIRQNVTSQYSRNWFLRLPKWRIPFI